MRSQNSKVKKRIKLYEAASKLVYGILNESQNEKGPTIKGKDLKLMNKAFYKMIDVRDILGESIEIIAPNIKRKGSGGYLFKHSDRD